MLRLGLDIGGTKIEAVVLNPQGEVVYKQRSATQKTTYPAFRDDVIQVIERAQQQYDNPLSIGICLPGSVSPSSGLIKNSNILVLNGQPFQQDLSQRFSRPVVIANDGNCFALSEAVDGAAAGADIVFGVILGTGCGGGLAIGQRMINGNNANAGECGHNPLPGYSPERDGPATTCYCGQQNCVESFVSGTGLAQRFQLRTGRALSAGEIIALARQGDAQAAQQFELFLNQLARALAAIVNLIDPGVIVLGGGLSNVPELYQSLETRVARHIFSDRFTTRILQARHGDSSGVRGAAWLGAVR